MKEIRNFFIKVGGREETNENFKHIFTKKFKRKVKLNKVARGENKTVL